MKTLPKSAVDDLEYHSGYHFGWQQAFMGERKMAPPHQSDDWLNGFDEGYESGKHRPQRRLK